MKNKSLIFALAAFVVLGALFFQQQGKKKLSVPHLGLERLLEKEISPEAVTRIRAFLPTDSTQTLELMKTDSGWVVANRFSAPAKADLVMGLLKSVAALEGEFRSDTPEILPDYGLTDEAAVHLALYQGDQEVAELLVGKEAGNYNECFIRREGTNRVFKVSSPLKGQLGIHGTLPTGLSDVKRWLDLTLLKFDREKARELVITVKGKAITYTRKEKATENNEDEEAKPENKKVEYVWEAEKVGKKTAKSSDEITGLMGVLSHFVADEVRGRGGWKEMELAPSAYSVKIIMEDGQEYGVSVGKKIDESGRRYAAQNSSDLVYSITLRQFEKVFGKNGIL